MKAAFSGVIQLESIRIPVRAHNLIREQRPATHWIHRQCQSRLTFKGFCPVCNCLVGLEDRMKGIAHGGAMVALEPRDYHDIAKLSGHQRNITVHSFTPLREIQPWLFRRSYIIFPLNVESGRGYRLLFEALKTTNLGAVVTFVSHGTDHLGLISTYALSPNLFLHTLYFFDEIVRIDERLELDRIRLTRREIHDAISLVRLMTTPFDHAHFQDRRYQRLRAFLDSGTLSEKTPAAKVPAAAPTNMIDLSEALKRALKSRRPLQRRVAQVRRSETQRIPKKARKAGL